MKTTTAAKWFGWVLLIVGVGGFLPFLTPGGLELGIFSVNPLHNVIHILSGLIALFCAANIGAAKTFFKIFAIVYGLVTILGFILPGGMMLGMMMNTADNLLHIVITLYALYFGFRMEVATA